MQVRKFILLGAVSVLWGSQWLFTPLLSAVLAPLAAVALASALAAVCLLPFARFVRHSQLRTTFLLAASMLVLPSVILTVANKHGASGWVPLLYAFLPLLTALDAWSPAMLIAPGAMLVLLGASVPLAFEKFPAVGMVLGAVGVQAFALRYAARRLRGFTVKQLLGSLGLQCAVGCVALAAASVLLDSAPRFAPFAQWNMEVLAGLAYGTIADVAVSSALLYLLLAGSGFAPQQIATTQWLQLLIGFAEASAFARARPSAQVATAAVLLAVCAAVVLRVAPGSNREDTPGISLH